MSPHEYIEKLRAENRALRSGVIELTREKQELELVIARQASHILELHRVTSETSSARVALTEVD